MCSRPCRKHLSHLHLCFVFWPGSERASWVNALNPIHLSHQHVFVSGRIGLTPLTQYTSLTYIWVLCLGCERANGGNALIANTSLTYICVLCLCRVVSGRFGLTPLTQYKGVNPIHLSHQHLFVSERIGLTPLTLYTSLTYIWVLCLGCVSHLHLCLVS